jgi:hypothetical protein
MLVDHVPSLDIGSSLDSSVILRADEDGEFFSSEVGEAASGSAMSC